MNYNIYNIISREDNNTLMQFTTKYLQDYVMDHRTIGVRHRDRWYIADLIYIGRWMRVWERYPYFIPAKLVHMQRCTRYAIGRGQWK